MKRYLLFILLMTGMIYGRAQQNINILFVNDNAAFAPNTETLTAALQQTGFSFSTFDAVAQMRSPQFNEMKDYDLVLWHTSTDGVGLYFWNGNDQDNPHLIEYLDNGGNLVVMGNDFLYDRYSTPTNFAPGDFVHDYLGTLVYQAQSYGDDGGQGVPQLDLVPGHNITTLNPVQWIFSTLWWADACLNVPGAVPVYKMGPSSYVLSNYYSAIYYQSNNFNTLSLFFDPALIDTDANRAALMGDIINYFQNLVGLKKVKSAQGLLKVWPNPAKQLINVQCETGKITNLTFSNMTGEIVKSVSVSANPAIMPIDLSGFAPGLYQITAWPYGLSQRVFLAF